MSERTGDKWQVSMRRGRAFQVLNYALRLQ